MTKTWFLGEMVEIVCRHGHYFLASDIYEIENYEGKLLYAWNMTI